MPKSAIDELFSGTAAFVIVAGLLTLALLITPFLFLAPALYIGIRLYRVSPQRLERLAREETEYLYQHARAGRVRLTDEDINTALSHHWPQDILDVSRIRAAPSARLGHFPFESDGAFPAQC